MENKVEHLRKAGGLSQDAFAKALQVSRQTVSAIETGKYNPSLELAFAGGNMGSGLMQLWKYFHWTKPENKEEYAKRLENERIAMKDERNRMLWDRARARAFIIGIYVICIAMIVFCVFDSLEVPVEWNTVVLCLAGYLALEFVAYYMAYKKLENQN